jgi:hypothetical protein
MAFQQLIFSAVRLRTALIVLAAIGFCGCAVVGPRSISAGRGAYAEVINVTEDEQLLNALVRMRYDQSFGMMSVASVTASLRFSAQAGGNFGVGPSDAYAGNTVPISVGVAYEENPTISYTPLSGEDFARRMLAPLAAGDLLLLSGASQHPERIFNLTVSHINGLRNQILGGHTPERDFARFLEIYGDLRRDGVLEYVGEAGAETEADADADADADAEVKYLWYIHRYADSHRDELRELLELLGLEVRADGSPIILPVLDAIGSSTSAIHLRTRSAYQVLELLGNGIEIPPSHLEAGIVHDEPVAWLGKTPFLKVRSSETHWWTSRPEDAIVAVRFRDRWFYIADTDTDSKRTFWFVRTMIGMRLAGPGANQQAPILTVPVN